MEVKSKKLALDIIELLKTIDDNGVLQEIKKELDNLIRDQKITVRYAGELTSSEKAKIETYVKSKVNGENEIEFIQDNKLIGGFQIQTANTIEDHTIKGRLEQFKSNYASQ